MSCSFCSDDDSSLSTSSTSGDDGAESSGALFWGSVSFLQRPLSGQLGVVELSVRMRGLMSFVRATNAKGAIRTKTNMVISVEKFIMGVTNIRKIVSCINLIDYILTGDFVQNTLL